MYSHVLCVYPYRRELGHFGFLPPLGLEYIAAVLAPHAHALDVVDLRKEPGHAKDFLRAETDMVCISVNWDRDAEFLLDEIRSIPPDIFTVLGGRHASTDPERWMATCPNVDVLVRGDGEEAVEELCRGVPPERIAGVSYRKDGQVTHNAARKLGPISDDLVPLRRTRRQPYPIIFQGLGLGEDMDLMAASRGCPFNCQFCSFTRNPWGEKRGWTGRSPESIVQELADIPAKVVAFTDDLFTFDMDRVATICDLILARGIRKKYIINARLEIARRPDVLKKMEQAGFTVLLLGVESTQDRTLRSMRKGFDTAKIREYCEVLKRSRMFLHGYFILGNIGENAEEILQIAPFAREIGIDTLGLSELRASPHSGLEELVAANPNYHIAANGKVYSDELSTRDLKALRRRIHRRFYSAGKILQLVWKGIQAGGLAFLPRLLPRLPQLVARTTAGALHRRKRRRREARARQAAMRENNPA